MKADRHPRPPLTTALARAYVARVLEGTLRSDIDNGSEWMEQHPDVTSAPLDDADRRRVARAVAFWQRRLQRAAAKVSR